MNVAALLTSAGINTAVSVGAFSLYSILRKQPSLVTVYFGQRISQVRARRHDQFCSFDRFVPSASWIMKTWGTSEDELYAAGGLDAVVFLRIVIFCIRIFSIAAMICLFLVLPFNYFGQAMKHKQIPEESLAVFTTENIKEGRWVWAHCLALYVITFFTCFLLYLEYKNIAKMRLVYITESLSDPSHFTVLVRGIPWSAEEPYSDILAKFFMDYYPSSYLSHQMVYGADTVQKLMGDTERMCQIFKSMSPQPHCGPSFRSCGLCGGNGASFRMLASECQEERERSGLGGSDLKKKEYAAAFVFFRTRYAALAVSEALQSPNPMLWVTDPAPEPRDIYWSNLLVPYKILWIRRIAILVASVVFVSFFLVPVSITQGLVHVEKLQKILPFLREEILKSKFMVQLVTGYLPSVILMLFLYTVPPLMLLFSKLEGSISRSGRKRSACIKVLYFTIWNVFFANILSGSVYERLGTNPREIPHALGRAVPATAPFFMTYVMTSGWASLSCELVQPFGLLYYYFYRFILRKKDESSYGTMTFPYHTEVPRILLFQLLGFTCSIFAPLILPFLLVYFSLAYLVYRNQLLNVYETKYQSGGLYWPIVHNATIFSLLLTQLIALGFFGLKESTIASGFTMPLIICTLLFNEYCRQRFLPIFWKKAAQALIQMDQEDEHYGRLEEIHEKLPSAYCQITSTSYALGRRSSLPSLEEIEELHPGRRTPQLPPPPPPPPPPEINELPHPKLLPLDFEEPLHAGRRSPKLPLSPV